MVECEIRRGDTAVVSEPEGYQRMGGGDLTEKEVVVIDDEVGDRGGVDGGE